MNENSFEWILVGNWLLPLFIYFATIDWLKYEQIKLLFHCATMPICMAQAWQQYSLLLFFIWICIIHQTIRKAIDSPAGWLCITKWLPVSLHDYPSVSQSFCVPVNHPVSCQSVNPHCFLLASLKADCQSVKQTAGQSVSQSVSLSVCQSVYQSISQVVSCCQLNSLSVALSCSQSLRVKHQASWSINWSVSQSVC